MSIEVLFDLQLEVRRLFIAGSGVAADDIRLKKMLPQLHKLGEAAPVFQRVALAVQQVVEPPAGTDSGSAASRLLELGTLLSSILYTQGKTDIPSERTTLAGTDSTLPTSIPYRKIKPVLEALTTKGSGRLEIISQAYEEGLFNDFRLLAPAVAALDDSYSEFADFVFRKVIPSWGTEALPALHRQLNLQGGKGDARRLQLIHAQGGSELRELYLKAVSVGAPEVRAQAVELLGHYREFEELVIEHADDKRKEVRQAAYMALARLGTAAATERLYRVLLSKDRELAIEPIRLCAASWLTGQVIDHVEQLVDKLKSADASQLKETAHQLHIALQCLADKREEPVRLLLQSLLSSDDFLVKGTEDAQETAARLLLDLQMPEADQFALTLRQAHERRFIAYSFRAALRTLAPSVIYDLYAPFLKNKKDSSARELLNIFHAKTEPVARQFTADAGSSDREYQLHWDSRWVDLFIAIDEEELVCRLAETPEKKLFAYLVRKCQAAKAFSHYGTVSLLLTLFRLEYKDAPEVLMETLERHNVRQLYYLDSTQLTLLSALPGSYADRLASFAEKLPYEGVIRQLQEVVETIKAKPDEASDEETKGTGWFSWIKSKMS